MVLPLLPAPDKPPVSDSPNHIPAALTWDVGLFHFQALLLYVQVYRRYNKAVSQLSMWVLLVFSKCLLVCNVTYNASVGYSHRTHCQIERISKKASAGLDSSSVDTRQLTDESLIRCEASEVEYHGNPSQVLSVNCIKGSNVNMIQRRRVSNLLHLQNTGGSFGTF